MTELVVRCLVLHGQLQFDHHLFPHQYLQHDVSGALLESVLYLYQFKPIILAYSFFELFTAFVDVLNLGKVALAPQ